MGTLTFTATMSVDGYVADADGDFQWAGPGDAVFAAHIDRLAQVSTEVHGRRTHLLMAYWDAEPEPGAWGPAEHEWARLWAQTEKIVASSTLSQDDLSKGARLVPHLELDELEQIVRDAPSDVEIFGPTTAAPAIRAGLVDEFRLYVVPKVVGGGLRAFPDDANLDLELVDEGRLDAVTYLRLRRR